MKNRNFIYPGNIWHKRIAQLLIVFGIGPNFFINDLQSQLLETGQETLELADTLATPAVEAAALVETEVLPFLHRIESSGWGSALIHEFGLPSSEAIQGGIDKVYRFREVLSFYGPMFKGASLILRISNWLFWLVLIRACLWLGFDVAKGNAKRFVLAMLMASVPWNYFSYHWLDTHFGLLMKDDMSLLNDAAGLTGFLETFQ